MIKLLKKTYTKLKAWWYRHPFEKKLKKIRTAVAILSGSIILWKTGPKPFLKDFCSLLQDRAKHFFASLAIAGILANTPLDNILYRFWTKNFKDKKWMDKIVKCVKKGGEHADLYFPFCMALLFISTPPSKPQQTLENYQGNQENQWLYDWATQTIWHFMEGAVLQGIGTCVLGAARPVGGSRPNDEVSSYWFPFRSKYGISGHAYHGAFPWMVLAETTSLQTAKPILYAFSLLPGLSRLHTDSHYPSQIFLGWSFAYASATHAKIEDISAYIKPRSNLND